MVVVVASAAAAGRWRRRRAVSEGHWRGLLDAPTQA